MVGVAVASAVHRDDVKENAVGGVRVQPRETDAQCREHAPEDEFNKCKLVKGKIAILKTI